MLTYAALRAPFKGVVTRRNINRGDFVQSAAAKADPRGPIFAGGLETSPAHSL
jgi:multidrug efflux pump subunit AcrA (membrane-fusion protein)